MASMTEITCACGCGRKKMVRTADVKRGWGKYYSKSCKARHQTRKTGRGKPKGKCVVVEEFEKGSLDRALDRRYNVPPDVAIQIVDKQEDMDDWERDMLYYELTTHPFSPEALGQD